MAIVILSGSQIESITERFNELVDVDDALRIYTVGTARNVMVQAFYEDGTEGKSCILDWDGLWADGWATVEAREA